MTLLALMVALVLALAVGACGSDDDDGGSTGAATSASTTGGASTGAEEAPADDAQAAAQANIEEHKKIPQFDLPNAKPVDVSKAKGKTVFNIPVSSTIPYVAAVDKEMKRVAEEHGVKFIQFENEGNPTQWAAGINQAINQKVDLIILQAGNDPRLVIPQLRRAKQAGIPVLVSHLYQNGTEPPEEVRDLITAYVTVPFWESGELSVDYAIAQDGCDGVKDVVIITAEEVPPSNGIVEAMKKRLNERCPDAKAQVINVPVVDWGTKIAPEVQSAVSSNPNIKWVLPIYDSMGIPAVAGIRAAGRANDVRIASYNGTPDVLKLIQDGDIYAADMGENINWLGWANMDQAFRILADGPIIEDGNENTPLRVFDDSNVDETGVPPTPDKGYGDSYITGYKKLWGEE
jgi:ribose transport system substrate-binding protein